MKRWFSSAVRRVWQCSTCTHSLYSF